MVIGNVQASLPGLVPPPAPTPSPPSHSNSAQLFIPVWALASSSSHGGRPPSPSPNLRLFLCHGGIGDVVLQAPFLFKGAWFLCSLLCKSHFDTILSIRSAEMGSGFSSLTRSTCWNSRNLSRYLWNRIGCVQIAVKSDSNQVPSFLPKRYYEYLSLWKRFHTASPMSLHVHECKMMETSEVQGSRQSWKC